MVLDDNNLLKGAFDRPGLDRTSEKRDRSSRRNSIISIVLAVIWVFGFASLIGAMVALMARMDAESPKTRRLAHIALGLNLLGIVVAVAFAAT